jgi:hypothetical protein
MIVIVFYYFILELGFSLVLLQFILGLILLFFSVKIGVPRF